MKKKTVGAIILAFDICMVVAIIFLVVKIVARGPKPEIEVAEEIVSEDEIMTTDISDQREKEGAETNKDGEKHLVASTNADSSVNVRSGPGTDYQRIGSAYSDVEYEVLEIGDEWVKIQYDDNNVGYVSAEYVEYQLRIAFEDGTASYSDATKEDVMKFYTGNGDGPVLEDKSDQEDSENQEDSTAKTDEN